MTDFVRHIGTHLESQRGVDAVRVTVIDVAGSAPREPGAGMLVGRDHVLGTIGGGRLEYDCIERAHAMLLDEGFALEQEIARAVEVLPLGPALGQCCGGTVRVLFERYGSRDLANIAACTDTSNITVLLRPIGSGDMPIVVTDSDPEIDAPPALSATVRGLFANPHAVTIAIVRDPGRSETYIAEVVKRPGTPLFVYGAGHVGRAVIKIATELDFAVHWVDTHAERFPAEIPAGVERIIARAPAIVARSAPPDAFHLVLTYSHALDQDICHAILTQPGFGFLGLIGSATKRARFLRRLGDAGVPEHALARLTCPIGTAAIHDKSPMAIAVSAMAQILEVRERIARHHNDGNPNGADQRLSA